MTLCQRNPVRNNPLFRWKSILLVYMLKNPICLSRLHYPLCSVVTLDETMLNKILILVRMSSRGYLYSKSTLTVIMQLCLSNGRETYIFKKLKIIVCGQNVKFYYFFYFTLFILFCPIINLYDEIAFIYKVLWVKYIVSIRKLLSRRTFVLRSRDLMHSDYWRGGIYSSLILGFIRRNSPLESLNPQNCFSQNFRIICESFFSLDHL